MLIEDKKAEEDLEEEYNGDEHCIELGNSRTDILAECIRRRDREE